MHLDLFDMFRGSFIYNKRSDGSNDSHKTYVLFAKIAGTFSDSIENIVKADDQLIYWKMLYDLYTYCYNSTYLSNEFRNVCRGYAIEVGENIQEKEPEFKIAEMPQIVSAKPAPLWAKIAAGAVGVGIGSLFVYLLYYLLSL